MASAAAAVAPSTLVTLNLKDFGFSALQEVGVNVRSPDEFLTELFENGPAVVDAATREAAANLSHGIPTWDDYLTDLATRHGLRNFVELLRAWKPEDTEHPDRLIPTMK